MLQSLKRRACRISLSRFMSLWDDGVGTFKRDQAYILSQYAVTLSQRKSGVFCPSPTFILGRQIFLRYHANGVVSS